MFPCKVCKNKYGKKVAHHPIIFNRKKGFKIRCYVCGNVKPRYVKGKTMKRAEKEDGN